MLTIINGKIESSRNLMLYLGLIKVIEKVKTRRLIVCRIQSPAKPAFAHETSMTRDISTFVVKLFKSFM